MRRTGGLALVLFLAVSLTGCLHFLHFRNTGPCYGVGCPAFADAPRAGSEAQSAPARKTQAAANQPKPSAAKAAHRSSAPAGQF